MTKDQILIIDDEDQIRKLLVINLESNGYVTQEASSGKLGIALAANLIPDLILLDIGLPDLNGQEVLREIRTWYDRPILILSVLDNEEEIVKALDNGATDYITKPFRTNELLARIRANLKRHKKQDIAPTLFFGDLTLDFHGHALLKNNNIIKLTATEYKLISLLAMHEGRVLTHQFLLKEIWGIGYQNDTQYLRVFIASLRKKIEDDPSNPVHLITESGVGYRFL